MTVVDRGTRLLPFMDAEHLRGVGRQPAAGPGPALMFERAVDLVQRGPEGLVVHVDGEALPADVVLQAVGREGNVQGDWAVPCRTPFGWSWQRCR